MNIISSELILFLVWHLRLLWLLNIIYCLLSFINELQLYRNRSCCGITRHYSTLFIDESLLSWWNIGCVTYSHWLFSAVFLEIRRWRSYIINLLLGWFTFVFFYSVEHLFLHFGSLARNNLLNLFNMLLNSLLIFFSTIWLLLFVRASSNSTGL